MTKRQATVLKRLGFFWTTSFSIAIGGYYLLWLIMPQHYVFGAWLRMFLYHYQHPVQYIAIPCFIYGLAATLYADKFYKQATEQKVVSTLIMVILTMLLSSPFGGMLWNFHDMQAGYFPVDWVSRIFFNGISRGLSTGWLIIALSIPYNLFGLLVTFFLTKKGAVLIR